MNVLVHVHGHDEQLFDVDDDPGEWTSLAATHDTKELRDVILEQFDPDAIARATALAPTRRNDSPAVDATRQCVR